MPRLPEERTDGPSLGEPLDPPNTSSEHNRLGEHVDFGSDPFPFESWHVLSLQVDEVFGPLNSPDALKPHGTKPVDFDSHPPSSGSSLIFSLEKDHSTSHILHGLVPHFGHPTSPHALSLLKPFTYRCWQTDHCSIISSLLFMLEVQTKWYLPAPKLLGWHVGFWNLIGAIGFTLCGALGFAAEHSESIEYALTLSTFVGSWAFLVRPFIHSPDWRFNQRASFVRANGSLAR